MARRPFSRNPQAVARYQPGLDVRVESQRPLTVRSVRKPQHTWFATLLPWQQVPVICAPVLAGESLKAANIQARVVSSPVVSNVTGWWLEFYLFYVRVGDLDEAQVMRAMIADPSQSTTSINTAALSQYYHTVATLPNFALMCHRVVSRAYFRKEGEVWNSNLVGAYPGVQYGGSTFFDSLALDTELGSPTGADGWALTWSAFQAARSAKLTTNTWEEYLAKTGVRVPPQMRVKDQLDADLPDFRIPELVRFVRDFAYPVPTVDNTTGAIRSTLQWSVAERIDKRRFFAEPGFLFGLMVVRPKVYMANQNGSMVDYVCSYNGGWMPPEMDTDPHTSMGQGTISTFVTGGSAVTKAWADNRDLYLYGDQFLPSGTPPGASVALPAVDMSVKKYPSLTDAHSVFTDTTNGVVTADGICNLRIASRIGSRSSTT